MKWGKALSLKKKISAKAKSPYESIIRRLWHSAPKIFKSVKYYLLVFSWSKLAKKYMIWYFTGGWEGEWSELDNKDHLSWAGLCWAWQKLSLNEVSNKNKRKFLPFPSFFFLVEFRGGSRNFCVGGLTWKNWEKQPPRP